MNKISTIAIKEVCKKCDLYTKNCGMMQLSPSGCIRAGNFINGYRKAEKDTIDKAINVLRKQIDDLIYSRLTIGDFLKQFRKTMEEE